VEREAADWRARLPEVLVEHVVWPVRVAAFHDDGVPASKWRGYDVLGLLCYYRHVYSRWSADFDDADEAPLELLQQEELEAWRTLLGTWVRRVQRVRCVHAGGPATGGETVVDTGFELVTQREIPRL
jgi:hypothetical protein